MSFLRSHGCLIESAYSLLSCCALVFDAPLQVQVATGCSLAFVEADAEDDSTLVGFPFEDICQEMTV